MSSIYSAEDIRKGLSKWNKAHWEVTYYFNDSVQAKECKCSVCNTIVDEEKPFCPNCKAEMKGAIYIF